jgi:GAF domain-containing protein
VNSLVPRNSLKIGAIARIGKPVITNDVLRDSRIRHPDCEKKEKLRSFAGYPLTYESKVIGVMAMFSEQQLLPADFELLGIFCDNVFKELSAAFGAQEYLAVR